MLADTSGTAGRSTGRWWCRRSGPGVPVGGDVRRDWSGESGRRKWSVQQWALALAEIVGSDVGQLVGDCRRTRRDR
jgi:hypothetical protein